MKRLILLCFVLLASIGLVACGSSSSPSSAKNVAEDEVNANQNKFVPYVPHNEVEGHNYNRAQELYDNPATIIWCTAFPQSNTDPIVTIPVAGKLTSSTVSARPSNRATGINEGGVTVENSSIDGLYHGTPPPYRYGFTPGGQYVDFFNMPTICTTQPLEFQKESISLKPAAALSAATNEAEEALEGGAKAKAQHLLAASAPGK